MKKIILLFMIPILIGLSNVSADESWTGATTAPVAVDDTAVTNEYTLVVIDLIANDTDVDLDNLTVTWILNMLNWTWVINTSWTWVIFTPDLNFHWTWSFDYIVTDWELTDTWSVIVTVNSLNDAPVAVDDVASTTENTSIEIDLISNDLDADWDTLTVTTLWTILNWTWVITTSWTGVIFTPNTGFKWMVSFIYTVSDWSFSDVWNVLINVDVENSAPVAINDTLTTNENTPKTIDPRGNDTDEDWNILSITWVTDWLHWIVEFSSVSVRYIPDEDYYGWDSFTYTINDWNWWTDIWTVIVTVNIDNDNDYDDDYDWNTFREKHIVQAVQKEFISKFKQLKNQYKISMWQRESRNEYLRLKTELRAEYLFRLKEVTGQVKKYSYEWNSVKLDYKNIYKNKYWYKISQYSDSKIETLIWKIDDLIADVNVWNYSDTTRAKLNTMLLALRELALEYMDNDEDILDIDSLFE